MLTSMQPIRDRRDRVVGYAVSTCPASRYAGASDTDDDSRQLVEQVSALSRLAGRSLVVPVTPAIVRDGALTRFAATDTVWMIATDALDDPATRRAVDRLVGAGCHFALQGFPEGEPLPPSLAGSTIVLDAARTPPSTLEARLRVLLDAGLRDHLRRSAKPGYWVAPSNRGAA
jgi:hypothetical protein